MKKKSYKKYSIYAGVVVLTLVLLAVVYLFLPDYHTRPVLSKKETPGKDFFTCVKQNGDLFDRQQRSIDNLNLPVKLAVLNSSTQGVLVSLEPSDNFNKLSDSEKAEIFRKVSFALRGDYIPEMRIFYISCYGDTADAKYQWYAYTYQKNEISVDIHFGWPLSLDTE